MAAKVKTDPDSYVAELRAKGITFTETKAKLIEPAAIIPEEQLTETGPVKLLESKKQQPGVWLIGVETRSESNGRKWKDRSNRTKAARAAVSHLFGRTLLEVAIYAHHYHTGGPLSITFTRIAPGKLDRGNVPPALKAVEDAVAMFLGADDGDARWNAKYEQEHGPAYGVRIEMRTVV